MRTDCRRAIAWGLLCLFSLPTAARADEITDAQRAAAINAAGRLRFLSQKTIKEGLQVLLGVEPAQSLESLKQTVVVFERDYRDLIDGNPAAGLPKPSERYGDELDKIDPHWLPYRVALDEVVAGQGSVARLEATNTPLLASIMAHVEFLAAEIRRATGKDLGTVINVAGRQRMLSQRTAKLFYLIAAGHEVERHRKLLAADLELFEASQKGLLDGDASLLLPAASDAEVRAQLAKVSDLWTGYRAALAKALEGTPAAEDLKRVAALNVEVLREADAAVKMFEGKWGRGK